uniref:WD repeat-containing protein 17-like n=1 Tax=Haplochromis burtoni TaxID=8153 RepID=A0A3Q2W098_HAPBU
MVELGQWEKALSVAPGVSMKYWKKLMQRRADQLMAEDNDDAIPYCVATGDIKKLVTFFSGRGQLLEALLIAQGACEGNIRAPQSSAANHTTNDVDNSLLHKVCKDLAEWYFQDGCSVLAACCHLAVDDVELAMSSLMRGNELELAACVGIVLGEGANQSTAYCLQLLARKYMTNPTWELSADLLRMIPDNHVLLAKLCAFYPGTAAEINQLHERCGLPSLEECKVLAEEAVNEGDLFSAVKLRLLSPEPEVALQIGINHVKGTHTSASVQQLEVHRKQRFHVFFLHVLVHLLKRREVCVPLKIEQLSVELDAWRACTQANSMYVTHTHTHTLSHTHTHTH